MADCAEAAGLANSEKAHTKANGAFNIVIQLFLEPLDAAETTKSHRIWKREQCDRGSLVSFAMFHRSAANAFLPRNNAAKQPLVTVGPETSSQRWRCSVAGRRGRLGDSVAQRFGTVYNLLECPAKTKRF